MTHSLDQIQHLMRQHGATRFYAKKLSPNDNSKNQIYLGGDFSALNIIPYSNLRTDTDETAGSKRDRTKADVTFYWVGSEGKSRAPYAQLILYPKYPEVRLSGLLRNSPDAPTSVLASRETGRILLLGITHGGVVLGYAATSADPLAREIASRNDWVSAGVFIEVSIDPRTGSDSKDKLIWELRRIHNKKWIGSQRLNRGAVEPYVAPNAGGYTLEAELGISPNGYSEPDFMGWEVKQYGVRDFVGFAPKSPVTLMTPEPTAGIYKDQGPDAFLRLFGYQDKKGVPDRINFGGIYRYTSGFHPDTGLRLSLSGFDASAGKITSIEGGIVLLTQSDQVAAMWNFASMMEHWKRKHSNAAYVPSIHRPQPPSYAYGPRVQLCEGTEFTLLLNSIVTGHVYYDPGIKMEGASTSRPFIKRRSQFRITQPQLVTLYRGYEIIDFA